MVNENHLAEFLLILGVLFALTYCLAGLLVQVRIPAIIAALFVGMFIHYTTLGERLLSPELLPLINVLAQLGVLFLLFFIGLQIDLQKMRSLGADILYCTGLNTIIPFIFGMIVMLLLGYGWLLAFIIGLTRMPTAEAVIVPILDEFQLIRTRVGEIIIGVGTLDDVIEIVIITIVSIWISGSLGLAAGDVGSEILAVMISFVLFLFIAWLSYRWIVPRLANYLPVRVSHLMMLCIVIMFSLYQYIIIIY
ncbi:MAG: cation:proton antiporter [Gammaproteobacteria bacterium]|nr:cation:proton antiporter [Gammaproteobacteria bacterium]